jgi:hypothetical protein
MNALLADQSEVHLVSLVAQQALALASLAALKTMLS